MQAGRIQGLSLGLLALAFFACAVIQYYTLPCTDIAWLVWGTRQMLSGAALYKDVIESNPPLIFWIYAIPVALADHLHWPPVLTLKMGTLLLIALSSALSNLVLKRSSLWRGSERYPLLLAITALLLLADSFFVFAQREHLLVICTIPYVLLNLPSATRRDVPAASRAVIGLLAGLGVCLKPVFFLIPLAVLAFRFRRERSLRSIFGVAEIAAMAVALDYAVAIALFAPYYKDWLAIYSVIFTASDYLHETWLDRGLWFACEAAGGIGLFWYFGLLHMDRKASYRPEIHYLMAIAAAAFVQALIQFKTWEYISFPFFAFGMVAIFALIIIKPITSIAAILVATWAFFPVLPFNDTRQDVFNREHADLAQAIAPYHAHSWYLLDLSFASPRFYLDTHPAWTEEVYNIHFMLSGIMQKSPSTDQPNLTLLPGRQWIERWLLNNIADTLEKQSPDLIVMKRQWFKKESMQDAFDFTQWVTHSQRLENILRQHYRFQKEIALCSALHPKSNRHCRYRIYLRDNFRPPT